MGACLPGSRPAGTRLHVHGATVGVEARWVGLGGKWPQQEACGRLSARVQGFTLS